MNLNKKHRNCVLKKELAIVEKQEAKPATWKTELEKKIPEKVYAGLEDTFC